MLYGYKQFPHVNKRDDIYKDITEDVDLDRPLPKGKRKKKLNY